MAVVLQSPPQCRHVLARQICLRVEEHAAHALLAGALTREIPQVRAKHRCRGALATDSRWLSFVTHDACLDGHALPAGAHRKLRAGVPAAASLAEPRRPVTQATVLAHQGFDATRELVCGPNAPGAR